MRILTGACIKPCLVRLPLCHIVNLPSCVARRPLCHNVNLPSCVARQPLCHKVNLSRCEARRRHLIMTCDIFGTRQTNTVRWPVPSYMRVGYVFDSHFLE